MYKFWPHTANTGQYEASSWWFLEGDRQPTLFFFHPTSLIEVISSLHKIK